MFLKEDLEITLFLFKISGKMTNKKREEKCFFSNFFRLFKGDFSV